MHLCGEGNLKKGTRREIKNPQFTRGVVLKCNKSQGFDPKPDDLALGKVKRR